MANSAPRFDPEFATCPIARWNDGAIDGCRGIAARSDDPDYLEGLAHGKNERKVRVVMPHRPEGYYHSQPDGASL
jgi:hypothetical protein